LDFGPCSVDGWLARLVASELGVEDDGLLDSAARELVVDGRRTSLSKLEFGVMEYLHRHSGQQFTRFLVGERVGAELRRRQQCGRVVISPRLEKLATGRR